MQRRQFLLAASAIALSAAIRPALAEATSFDMTALADMRKKIEASIAAAQMPGAVWLVAKGDDVVVETAGSTAYKGGKPMARDTIFRIASVGKAVGTAAVMMLVEDGKLTLDEPVDRLLPELANRQVLKALNSPITDTVPAARPITVRDVMNFTLGFGLQFDPTLPINGAIDERKLVNGPPVPATPWTPDEWMAKFGELPLMAQPGATWMYNTGSLVMGVLIARAAQMPLPYFLDTRIFKPLGMKDTGFFVPPEKLDRFQPAFSVNFATNEQFEEDPVDGQWAKAPSFPSTAGGLVSTVDDYLSFARMLMNKGAYPGGRLLSEASVAEMTRDQLTAAQKDGAGLGPGFFTGHGWGYGVMVYTEPDAISPTPGRYGWDGGYGTSWANDPNSGLIGMMFTQSVAYYIGSGQFHDFWSGAFQSIGIKGAAPVAQVITKDITVTRTYDAPADKVWAALTTEAGVKTWWGPNGYTAPVAKMDVREGGTTLVAMRGPDGVDIYMTWVYSKVVPGERLEYVQNLSTADGGPIDPAVHNLPPEFPRDTTAVVTLAEKDGKTELTFVEHTTTSEFMMQMSEMGLEQCLDKLGQGL
jgi:CubicO group peptidase (beta-lactamase class C family)